MNVIRLSRDVQLGPLVEASQAEGFNFVARLQLELTQGNFTEPGAALYGYTTDELVGVGGLTPDPYPDAEPGVGRLRHLYVLPHLRRQQVGQKLVTAIITEAGQHYRVLRLRTTTPEAAQFYEVLGFSPTSEPDATHRLGLR